MASEPRHTKAKALVRIAAIAAIVAAAVFAVNFALYPYGAKSQVSWHDFREQRGLDAVCLGTSLALRAYDPAVVDAGCATSSFNMSTPGQTVRESYLGLQEAVEHHDIKRVFLGIDYWALWLEPTACPRRVYLDEKWKGDDIAQRISDLAYLVPRSGWLLGEKSVNWLFPWTEQHANFSLVGENMRMKLERTPLDEASERIEQGWTYYGQGYGNYDGVYDYNASYHLTYADHGMRPLTGADLEALGDICDFCSSHGIELIVFVPPICDANVVALKDYYADYYRDLSRFVLARGGSFYDFNLARPELFASEERYFADTEHLNAAGASAFSDAVARLMCARERGEDVAGMFMSFGERLARIGIVVAGIDFEVGSETVRCAASCLAGSAIVPEYRFSLVSDDGTCEVVRDYSTDDTYEFAPDGAGVYVVRVDVRRQGSTVGFEKHAQHDVVVS